jgi:hypothetical protein
MFEESARLVVWLVPIILLAVIIRDSDEITNHNALVNPPA